LETKEPLILITNDDGINSKGIKSLIEVAREFGRIVIVAPSEGQSGMAHAITVKTPIRVHKSSLFNPLEAYICSGTPVDCVKMAFNQLLKEKPSLILTGINHGGNASSSVIYSGTMAAAIEGCFNDIPSIGFSLLDFSRDADFTATQHFAKKIIQSALKHGIPKGHCLNVNVPAIPLEEIKGLKVCRQNHGVWREEFDKRCDPSGHDYYWLTGTFENLEPEAEETDIWALKNNYVSIVPVHYDMTAYKFLEQMKKWSF
jgi:5'-nucleotidase